MLEAVAEMVAPALPTEIDDVGVAPIVMAPPVLAPEPAVI